MLMATKDQVYFGFQTCSKCISCIRNTYNIRIACIRYGNQVVMHCYNLRFDIVVFAKSFFHPYALSMSYFTLVSIRSSSSKRNYDYIVIKFINLLRKRKEFLKQKITCVTIVMVSREDY